jgi:hypothetical protein
MPNSEGGNQNQYLFYVTEGINRRQSQYKQLVVKRIGTDNVFPSQHEIKTDIRHNISMMKA